MVKIPSQAVRVVPQVDEQGRCIGYSEVLTFATPADFAEFQKQIENNKQLIALESKEKDIVNASSEKVAKLSADEKAYVKKYSFSRFLAVHMHCAMFGKFDTKKVNYDKAINLPSEIAKIPAGLQRAKFIESIVNSDKYEALGKLFNAMEE